MKAAPLPVIDITGNCEQRTSFVAYYAGAAIQVPGLEVLKASW